MNPTQFPVACCNKFFLERPSSEARIKVVEKNQDFSISFTLKTSRGEEYTLEIPSMMSDLVQATLTEKYSRLRINILGTRESFRTSLEGVISRICQGSFLKEFGIFNDKPMGRMGTEVACVYEEKNPVAEAAYSKVKERFLSPVPVTCEEVEDMFEELFSPLLRQESLKYLNKRSHPASIVYYLHEVFTHLESSPQEAMVPIGGKEKGKSGAYFLCTNLGEKAWVFKPANEEPGAPGSRERATCDGIVPGEGAIREHIADIINELSGGFFNIPKTVLIDFNGQVGSAQSFITNLGSVQNYMMGSKRNPHFLSEVAGESIQRSTAFDVIFSNGDRHIGNLLIQDMDSAGRQAIMIDQGMILSADVSDPMKFDQACFPQNESSVSNEVRDFVMKAPIAKWKKMLHDHSVDRKAADMVDRNLTFFQACLNASEEYALKGGLELEMKDIAVMALMMHRDIVVASDQTLKSYAQFIVNLKSGLHEWDKWQKGGEKSLKAGEFNRIRALMKSRCMVGLKKLGLNDEPLMSAEEFSLNLYKLIIDPYINRDKESEYNVALL